MDGIIIVDKPLGISSHDVVSQLRKIFKTKRVGHAGTLDPQASGVLVCMLNKATKLSNYLVLDNKEYIASFKLGVSTTTQDLEGDVVEEKLYQKDITSEQLLNVIAQFIGVQNQVPSIYSAIKVNGKKLYEYARHNEEVEIPVREIEVYDIELLDFDEDIVTIKVACSSGTYIRSLCFDIAKALGYPGVLTALRRTQSGQFSIQQASTLDQIKEDNYTLISIKDALADYLVYQVLSEVEEKQVKNGVSLEIDMPKDFIVLDRNDNVIALYQKSEKGKAKIKRGLW